jgi:hypothetical protein
MIKGFKEKAIKHKMNEIEKDFVWQKFVNL